MKAFVVNFILVCVRAIKIGLILLILMTIVLVISNYLGKSMEATPGLIKLNSVTKQIDSVLIQPLKMLIPTKFYGKDWSMVILVVVLLIISGILSSVLRRLQLIKQHISLDYKHWRNQLSTKLPKAAIEKLDKKYTELTTQSESATTKDRKQMLKEFVKLKNELNTMGQECAFLSVDVVNSTGMKAIEDKLIATHDFNRYNEIAIACLLENGVIKYTTTPDGIMSCFRTVDDAVKAARALIEKLKDFNKNEKHMKMDFQVRCGINSGFVYIEGMPLEQVTDHVIDVAGHMQKNAKPNCINIAGTAIEPLKTRVGFVETTDIIDDKRVYTWSDK